MKRMTPSVISLITLAFCAFGASANAGLVAYYSFDTDYSLTGGSYTGTLSETENSGATGAISSVGDAIVISSFLQHRYLSVAFYGTGNLLPETFFLCRREFLYPNH